jgi:Zn-dependent protease with chaperone function
MALTHEEFVETVNRLEVYARSKPSTYRLRVGLLAALGYAYILFVLVVIFALVAAVIYFMFEGGRVNFLVIKFAWVLLALAGVVLRALWVRIPPPKGIEIRREQAPQLFALVDELTRALETPRVHVVLVNGEYNASLTQVPRLGLLGWQKNYLTLGLPLMQALSPAQFRAVLAHELGHLSGNHGRFASWVYRVRQTWVQLLQRLEREQRRGSFVFTKFINWYAPYLNAYSFVLARRHEYDADLAASQTAGALDTAEALAVVELKGAYLSEKYWPEVFKHADEQAEPVRGAYAAMRPILRTSVPAADAQLFLRRSLSQETGYDDTHPSLASRLDALGFDTDARDELVNRLANERDAQLDKTIDAQHGETASECFLGGLEEEFARRLDSEWFESVKQVWRERHKYVNESHRKLAALEEKARDGELTVEEVWSRAYWTAEFKTEDEAIPLLREVVARKPKHAQANFLLGQMLLARKDPSGVEHIERAMAAEPQSVPAGCHMLYSFFRSQGRDAEAENYRRRLFQHFDA